MVYGIWCMVYGVWYMVYGVWYMVYGIWCMVYGIWCMVYGVWYMMNLIYGFIWIYIMFCMFVWTIIIFIGLYRIMYILNWIYRSYNEHDFVHNWQVYTCGFIQACLYMDFIYNYFLRYGVWFMVNAIELELVGFELLYVVCFLLNSLLYFFLNVITFIYAYILYRSKSAERYGSSCLLYSSYTEKSDVADTPGTLEVRPCQHTYIPRTIHPYIIHHTPNMQVCVY
ncbi:hypothetical protein EON63_15575 [archaeon]|nr:MAG: hypothetical protein EON63_15575 [archaeon]